MRRFPQWRWHLDEVFVKINGKLCYLWRAVDHEGEVLETVVTAKRDKAAALKFLKRIMKKYGRPRSLVTDGLCSYPAAMSEIGNVDRHEVGRRLNNRAENSHQPFRRRERAMQRCEIQDFVAQSHTRHDCCVRFALAVAGDDATLAGRLALPLTCTGLPPAGSRQLRLAHLPPCYAPVRSLLSARRFPAFRTTAMPLDGFQPPPVLRPSRGGARAAPRLLRLQAALVSGAIRDR